MTKSDLIERAAFWQDGLMDVDHLRDVAYEAVASEFDNEEFRRIAGDARLSTDDARTLFDAALRRAGLKPPSPEAATRIVCASIARSILAGAIDPIIGADLIAARTPGEHSSAFLGPMVYAVYMWDDLDDEEIDSRKKERWQAECRTDIREHVRRNLKAIEAWAGVAARPEAPGSIQPGFLGWRLPA